MRTPQSHGSPEPAAGGGARVMGAPVCKGQREGVPSRGESSRAKRAPLRKPTIFSFRCPSRMELGQLQGGTGLGKQTSSQGSAAARRDGPAGGHTFMQPGKILLARMLLTRAPRELGDVASAADAGLCPEPWPCLSLRWSPWPVLPGGRWKYWPWLLVCPTCSLCPATVGAGRHPRLPQPDPPRRLR